MVRLVVWSDFVCPFCLVGEASVRRLREDFPELEVKRRGFELHPETSAGGAELEEVVHPARAAAIRASVARLAAEAGVAGTLPAVVANTRRAHQAAGFAAARGLAEPFHAAVMRAYWEAGRDVGDEAVLLDAWQEAGGDAADLAAFFRATARDATEHRAEAEDAGVSAVPTFDVMGTRRKRRVVGAQPYDVLRRVVEDVLAADREVEA